MTDAIDYEDLNVATFDVFVERDQYDHINVIDEILTRIEMEVNGIRLMLNENKIHPYFVESCKNQINGYLDDILKYLPYYLAKIEPEKRTTEQKNYLMFKPVLIYKKKYSDFSNYKYHVSYSTQKNFPIDNPVLNQ